MTTAITPEVVGLETTILENSPMTEQEEKELVIVKTAIKVAYADKLERDLAIGAGLFKIFQRKLYRSSKGGRSWQQWLAEESAELTGGRGPISAKTSEFLRGFYQFRCEILQPKNSCSSDIALPASPAQVRPLLSQLSTHPDAAVEIWKAACAQVGKGKVPTFDHVQRAAQAYKANEANEARRLSAAEQARADKANAARAAKAGEARMPEPRLSRMHIDNDSTWPAGFSDLKREVGSVPDYSPRPQPSASVPPAIPAWEIEKDDSALDAGAECRRIKAAINDVHKSIGLLRGILYSQINKFGRDYLGFLRQVDAGVYSLHDIDDQVLQMAEDIAFIQNLLTTDAGPGELSQSTVESVSLPTRG